MKIEDIKDRALAGERLDKEAILKLYTTLPTSELMLLGHTIRQRIKPDNIVSWIIDRNVNITNICQSGCDFCSFHCLSPSSEKAFITAFDTYKQKIEELFRLGGQQLLLQGGMHPDFRLSFYENLFRELKATFPELKLHALGPPEVFFLSEVESLSIKEVLERLVSAGLDSLPGAGAEILSDKIRQKISPHKCTSAQWLNVMREAHKLNLPTTATMMFGHLESPDDIIAHLLQIQQLQSEKPPHSLGFTAFIPWTFQSANTALIEKYPAIRKVSTDTYIRTIAISRIALQNIDNIQASWLTTGPEAAQLALWAGANDLGSVMIEENVVASSGVSQKLSVKEMQVLIKSAGFEPRQRNQIYEFD